MEYSNKFNILIYLNSNKNNSVDNKLIPKYRYKFLIKSKFITNNLLEKSLYPFTISIFVSISYPAIIGYFDPQKNYSIISIIFWNIILFISTINLFAIALGGANICWFALTYIKY